MSTSKYTISSQGKILDPQPLAQVRTQLNSKQISFTDYIWQPERTQWVMLANFFASEFPAPSEPPPGADFAVESTAAQSEPVASSAKSKLKKYEGASFDEFGLNNEAMWFLYRDNEKFGPYRYLELVQLLQQKKCTPEDFIWRPGLSDWERIRVVSEFSKELLEKVVGLGQLGNVGLDKIFLKRRFPRVPYDTEVVLHDDMSVVFGESTTISEGGAFVKVNAPNHRLGDRLKVHFSPAGMEEAFNCIGEITQVVTDEPTGYCLKFIYLEDNDQKRIKKFATDVKKAANK